jgi:outer membrane receptor protein involved in Fe transport
VDYYRIDLTDAISTLSADLVFARCFNQDGSNPEYSADNEFCQAIIRSPSSGAPDQTLTPYYNLGGIRTDGIDIQFDWSIPLDSVGIGGGNAGKIALNVVASRLLSFEVQASAGAPWVDYAGTTGYRVSGYDFASNNGSHPKWKANSSLTWSNENANLGVRWYFVGPMEDIVGGPGLESYSRFDLFGGYRINDAFSITAGVTNLFDKDPLKTFGGLPGNTDSGTYDVLGRRYFVSLKASFR